ncbi:Zn-dependent alcohol dehydrogenase family protein [Rhizoctonia solani AG-3 Rhs1AP]|uniref:alcohol dehydrogenase (NADP(+)) n=2 Tax=Rhizoctonia solani AG-3 TaxID=1086053 RepID=A0A074S3N4_9AGAM|nr:Zn-dependent alcohol dehydrogenase family protein [Rhizoctonia solani AG-3 Rhs1AP]KEP52160.1 Zn-dependent alcohol dehydrogenase family protein [Rhizoctonia solani 123E]
MSPSNTVFKGYGISDPNQWSDFKLVDIKPKTWDEEDIDVAVSYCGICGSDLHTITGGWGNLKELPLVVGHEIAGTVVRVGSIATQKSGIKVGDHVGIGPRCNACGHCGPCTSNNENYCYNGAVDTYNDYHTDGTLSQGGYSTAVRANHQYVFPIPDGLALKDAASMMCAGLTMYSPLVRNGAGPGKKVGIIGLGGLGHFGVLFAKALGCEVYVFSHSSRKQQDALKMGADHFVVSQDKDKFTRLRGKLDLIISTVDVVDSFPLADYLKLLVIQGTLINVGAPDTKLPQISAFDLLSNGCKIGGSAIGTKKEAIEMLELAVKANVKPWIDVLPMSKVTEAVQSMKAGNARYRFVLEQDIA